MQRQVEVVAQLFCAHIATMPCRGPGRYFRVRLPDKKSDIVGEHMLTYSRSSALLGVLIGYCVLIGYFVLIGVLIARDASFTCGE